MTLEEAWEAWWPTYLQGGWAVDDKIRFKAGWEAARTDRKAVLEEAAKACEAQQQIFLSEQYAANQPVSSIPERFACKQCAQAVRALAEGAGK